MSQNVLSAAQFGGDDPNDPRPEGLGDAWVAWQLRKVQRKLGRPFSNPEVQARADRREEDDENERASRINDLYDWSDGYGPRPR